MSNDDLFDFMYDEVEVKPIEEEIQFPIQQEVAASMLIKKFITDPCIADNDYEIVEETAFDTGDGTFQTVNFKIPARPTLDHERVMWDIINNFETRAWSANAGGLKTGMASFDKAFDGGWKPGFYVIAGDSNLGKTALETEIIWKIIDNNKNVFVQDFSLDDAMPDKLARMCASWNKVIINAVKTPNNYQHMPLMLLRRKDALNKLRANVDKYRAYDSNFSSFIEDIEQEIQAMKIELEKKDPNIQLVVGIDSFHDLNIKSLPSLTETQKYNMIAQWCADIAIKYDIVLISTAELKKFEGSGSRRPGLGDLRESIKIRYEAKAIMLVYNAVHYKGDNADIFFMKQNCSQKQPVFEVHIAKNKIHSYKGRFFYYFYPEMAYMEEVDDNTAKTFINLIS